MEINTKIDQLSDTLDFILNGKEGKRIVLLGLTVHYSVTSKKWCAGYGKKRMANKVFGSSAEDALRHLSEKMNTPNL